MLVYLIAQWLRMWVTAVWGVLCSNLAEGYSNNSIFAFGLINKTDKRSIYFPGSPLPFLVGQSGSFKDSWDPCWTVGGVRCGHRDLGPRIWLAPCPVLHLNPARWATHNTLAGGVDLAQSKDFSGFKWIWSHAVGICLSACLSIRPLGPHIPGMWR